MASPLPVDADASPNYTPAQHATYHNALAAFHNADANGAGGVSTKTANYTATATDACVLADATTAGFTVTLPAVVAGRQLTVKKLDSTVNLVTVAPASGTIDGAANDVISVQWQSRTYISNGTNWYRI